MRNFQTEKSTTTVTPTNTGTDAMIRTSHSVSISGACSEACSGNQSIRIPRAIPKIDATAPMASI
jgi:hypothetical protein